MYLIDTPVTAWIPVRTRLWIDQTGASKEALERLSHELPTQIEALQPEFSKVTSQILAPPKGVFNRLKSRSVLVSLHQMEFIRVTAQFTYDRDKFNAENPDHPLDEDTFPALAAMYLGEAIEPLLILTELAFPGQISTSEGLAFASPGSYATIRHKDSFHRLWFPDDGDPTWPALSNIALSDVVRWAQGTSFLKKALAQTRVERALAAFTHMIHLGPFKDGEILFRSMQALEAFYCDGIGDLRKQLTDKSSLWLGQWNEKKNIVGHLYDMRSKFVHGSGKIQYSTNHASCGPMD